MGGASRGNIAVKEGSPLGCALCFHGSPFLRPLIVHLSTQRTPLAADQGKQLLCGGLRPRRLLLFRLLGLGGARLLGSQLLAGPLLEQLRVNSLLL